MKIILSLILIVGSSMSALAADETHKSDTQKLDQRLQSARATINEIMSVPDKGIPEGITRKARCIAVIPGMVKGAFLVGAEYGQGVVTCRTARGWSAPAFIRMAGGSFGFQAGGQGTDLVLVAVNEKGFQALLHDKFKLGADASAAAGPVGRDAQAATDLQMKAELLTWSRSRGVFAGVDLSGVSVSQNKSDCGAMYGSQYTFEQILRGAVPAPTPAEAFLHAVNRYFGEARASR